MIINPEAIPEASRKFTMLLAEMINSGEIKLEDLIDIEGAYLERKAS